MHYERQPVYGHGWGTAQHNTTENTTTKNHGYVGEQKGDFTRIVDDTNPILSIQVLNEGMVIRLF